jgi:hypothetical protein
MVPVAAVPVTNTVVEAREASVPSGVKSAIMKSAKSAMKAPGMKPPGMEPAAVEPTAMESTTMESTTMESTTMESTTAVKTPAPAMGASIGKVRLAESSSEEQSSCHPSQNPSHPGPDPIFAIMLH